MRGYPSIDKEDTKLKLQSSKALKYVLNFNHLAWVPPAIFHMVRTTDPLSLRLSMAFTYVVFMSVVGDWHPPMSLLPLKPSPCQNPHVDTHHSSLYL